LDGLPVVADLQGVRVKDLTRIRTGKKGEELAVVHLQTLGYCILERNYRCPLGEIDIVAREKDTVVFVEVKSRKTEDYGDPELAVGRMKQRKLIRIALYYLTGQNDYPEKARFDVVAIKMLRDRTEVRLIRDAFELAAD
jgi:putative endonuclease